MKSSVQPVVVLHFHFVVDKCQLSVFQILQVVFNLGENCEAIQMASILAALDWYFNFEIIIISLDFLMGRSPLLVWR